jgi:hypothetical protein
MEGFSMSGYTRSSVELFTLDEHAVLAQWFAVEPSDEARQIDVKSAVERLGFKHKPGYRSLLDVAVAFIVLEHAENRLPQWASVSDEAVSLARQYRDRETAPDRKVLLYPQLLFEINWAYSGPGFSWPVAYYVTWVPIYERFVVTASADSPDAFGYCDFALGAFGSDTPIKEGAQSIIRAEWQALRDMGLHRWADLFSAELISETEADELAEGVWAK